MAALEKAGREGWHLVDFGTLRHVVEASDQQWEHRRVPLSLGARHRRLEEEGWQGVGSWLPWRYYKRPLGLPPEPATHVDTPFVTPLGRICVPAARRLGKNGRAGPRRRKPAPDGPPGPRL